MADPLTCPKCSGVMIRGYIPDRGHFDGWAVPGWVAGVPTQGTFGGVKKPERERFEPLAAMRCEGCGFVEFYAGGEFRAR